jgi:hypothetical protein
MFAYIYMIGSVILMIAMIFFYKTVKKRGEK